MTQTNQTQNKYTITKKIAKQGKNLLVIIPKNLHCFIKGGDLVEITINKMNQEVKNE